MEETAYEWESIKGMTNTALVDREITILQNQMRRMTKRLDYLHFCKNELTTSFSLTSQVQKELSQSSEPLPET